MKAHDDHICVYSLEEKNESDISPLWKMVQIFFYFCCIAFGFVVCYGFCNVMAVMRHNCLLYSKIIFDEDKLIETYKPHNIKIMYSQFHSLYCDIALYIPVIITMFASFFMVLFFMCGRGGAGNANLPDAWRIVLPTMIFNLTCFSLSAYTVSVFHGGVKSFLQNAALAWSVKNLDINQIDDLHLEGLQIGEKLREYLVITKQAFWMLVSFWGLNFFWILLRCIFNVDFQLVRTTIHVYPKQSTLLHTFNADSQENPGRPSLTESCSEDTIRPIDRPSSTVRFRTVQFSPSTQEVAKSEKEMLNFKDVSTETSSSFLISMNPTEEATRKHNESSNQTIDEDESSVYYSTHNDL